MKKYTYNDKIYSVEYFNVRIQIWLFKRATNQSTKIPAINCLHGNESSWRFQRSWQSSIKQIGIAFLLIRICDRVTLSRGDNGRQKRGVFARDSDTFLPPRKAPITETIRKVCVTVKGGREGEGKPGWLTDKRRVKLRTKSDRVFRRWVRCHVEAAEQDWLLALISARYRRVCQTPLPLDPVRRHPAHLRSRYTPTSCTAALLSRSRLAIHRGNTRCLPEYWSGNHN